MDVLTGNMVEIDTGGSGGTTVSLLTHSYSKISIIEGHEKECAVHKSTVFVPKPISLCGPIVEDGFLREFRTQCDSYSLNSELDTKLAEDEPNYLLPLVQHCELPSISVDTMKEILSGERNLEHRSLVVIDCRHSFEFEGGHIKGARNLQDPRSINEYFSQNLEKGQESVVIFHCEFSSVRAPKLFRHLRNLDRQHHIEIYPELGFPHMYILHGGYKAFYHAHLEYCEPMQYIRMLDPSYTEDLRVSTKKLKRSWSAFSRNETRNFRVRRLDNMALSDVSNGQCLIRSCSTSLKFEE